MSDDESRHLFGLPGEGAMEDSIAGVYEAWVDDVEPADCSPFTVEEWTSRPLGNELISTARVLEWMNEHLADEGFEEWDWERIDAVFRDAEVVAAFDVARDVLKAKLSGWVMADIKIADHIVTWGADGKPLVDGEPIYVPAKPLDREAVAELLFGDPERRARIDAAIDDFEAKVESGEPIETCTVEELRARISRRLDEVAAISQELGLYGDSEGGEP